MSFIPSHVAEEIILEFGYEQYEICIDYSRYKATHEAYSENPDMAEYITLNPPRHMNGHGHVYPRNEFIDFVHTYLIGIGEGVGEKIYAILSEADPQT